MAGMDKPSEQVQHSFSRGLSARAVPAPRPAAREGHGKTRRVNDAAATAACRWRGEHFLNRRCLGHERRHAGLEGAVSTRLLLDAMTMPRSRNCPAAPGQLTVAAGNVTSTVTTSGALQLSRPAHRPQPLGHDLYVLDGARWCRAGRAMSVCPSITPNVWPAIPRGAY
jgi:hypothetical protein